MKEIANVIMKQMPNIKKPQREFMLQLFSVLMLFVGKANFRNLSRYCQAHEKTISRWCRVSFDYIAFNSLLLISELNDAGERIAALDASFINKSGKQTDGLGKFWNGKNSKAEKGLEISLISVVDIESNTAYALEAKQTLDTTNKNDQTRVDLYTQQVKDVSPQLKALSITHLAVDAYYAKKKFIDGVTSTGLNLVGKLRIDADLQWKYEGPYSGVGRKKKFDGKFKISQDIKRMEHVATCEDGVEIYTTILYSKNCKRDLKVLLLQWNNNGKVGHAILYTTDLQLAPEKVLAYYKARFQIEFLFRDAKQHTGLTDCQSTKKEAIHSHVNASLIALNLLKIEDSKQSTSSGQNVISITSWKRKKFNQHYMKLLFSKLDLDLTCKKVASVFEVMSDYGAIAA